MSERQKILERDELREALEARREAGAKIVLCHGCFDIVHPGHVRYLQFARSQGEVLVVSVSADAVVRKGPDRPLIPELHRAENLAALQCVDYVTVEPHPTAEQVLDFLRPDFYVKGREYETSTDIRFLAERAVVEGYGGSVLFGSGDVVYSSSTLIGQASERIRQHSDPIRLFRERSGVGLLAVNEAFEKLASRRLLVVGDLLVDRYIHAERARVASEAPVLSVTPVSAAVHAGGAGIVARTLRRFGASVCLLGAADPDQREPGVHELLEGEGIELELLAAPGRKLAEKVRYFVDDRVVFKVDRAAPAQLPSALSARFAEAITEKSRDVDAVVAVDFGLGLFDHAATEALAEVATQRPVYVDVSLGGTANILHFQRPRVALPSETELRFALGDDSAGLSNLAARYFQQTEAEVLIITLAHRGFVLFQRGEAGQALPADHLPALGQPARDNVGAGDVLLALTAGVDSATRNPHLAAFVGALGAAVHIGQIGNDPIDPSEAYALGAALLGG